MKNIILVTLAAISLSVSAHTILGTQILKGSIKTKFDLNGVKTTCKIKVDKVKNLRLEDSYGNPAYNVRLEINLKGDDSERSISIRYDKDIWLNNLFTNGTRSEVRDFEYAGLDGTKMMIDRNGRIKSVTFTYVNRPITCSF